MFREKLVEKMIVVAMIVLGVVFAVPFGPGMHNAYAYNECGANTFFKWSGCSGGKQAKGQITGVFAQIFGWLSMGVFVAAVGGMIYGGYLYMTSRGNKSQTEKAMGVIRSVVIALVLYYGMFAIMNYLIPGGLFS